MSKQLKRMLSLMLVCCMMFPAALSVTAGAAENEAKKSFTTSETDQPDEYADSDEEVGVVAGHRIKFECEDGITILHDGKPIGEDGAVYTQDINYNCTTPDDAEKKDFIFSVEADMDPEVSIGFLIEGQFDSLIGVSGDQEEVLDLLLSDDIYDQYIIKGVSSDLNVDVNFIYPDVGCIGGYIINFITNGNTVECEGETITDENYVYDTDPIVLCSFQKGKKIWNKDAEKKDITFKVIDSVPEIKITGDYEEIVGNSDSTYTITGITSDLTVEIENAPEEDLIEGHKISFNYDSEVFYVYDTNYYDILNGDTVQTGRINTKTEKSPYPKDYTFKVYDRSYYETNYRKVSAAGDYTELIENGHEYTIKGITGPVTVNISVDETRRNINDAVRAFGEDFFRLTYQNERDAKNGINMIVSPLSLYTDVALLENGTANKTQEEILAMLTHGNDKLGENDLNEYIKKYMEKTEKNDVVHMANCVYISNRGDIRVNPDFVDTAHNYYDAEVFRATPDNATVDRINKWCSDNTNGAIKDVLKPNSLDWNTNSILLNAVAFDGKWKEKYADDQILKEKFKNYNGSKTEVDFLDDWQDYYYTDGKALAFTRPYEDGYKFVAVLPNEDVGVDKYIEEMNSSTFDNLLKNGHSADVHTRIPKFEFANELILNDTMRDMGMVQAFDAADADLSRLAPSDRNTYVNKVRQIAHVKLDENGTKAEAVTVIDCTDACADSDYDLPLVEIFLNRPFIYAIYDEENNIPLFVGTVGKMSDDESPIKNDTDDTDDTDNTDTDVKNTADEPKKDSDDTDITDTDVKDTSDLPKKDSDDTDITDTDVKNTSDEPKKDTNTEDPNPGDGWLGYLGDVNRDGKVTAKDSLLIQRFTVNLADLNDAQKKLADVDGNGKVTNADALYILRYTVKASVKYEIGEPLWEGSNSETPDTSDTPDKDAFYFLAPETFLDPYLDYDNHAVVIGNKIGTYWYTADGESYPVSPMTEAFDIETPVYKMPLINQRGIESVVFTGYNEAVDNHYVCYTDKVDLAGHEGMIYLLNCDKTFEIQEIYNPEIHGDNHDLKEYTEYTEGGWFSLDPESENYYRNSDYYKTYIYNFLYNDYWTDVPA